MFQSDAVLVLLVAGWPCCLSSKPRVSWSAFLYSKESCTLGRTTSARANESERKKHVSAPWGSSQETIYYSAGQMSAAAPRFQ